ncbi:MAG: HAD-IA family hydrolase [Clostridia bacterium]|nr:HAD-IA family hydrolase [Clostridia bacterium]
MTKTELLTQLDESTREIGTVVFDIGNTLLRFDRNVLCDKLLPADRREALCDAMFREDTQWAWRCFDDGIYENERIALEIVRENGLPEAWAKDILHVFDSFHTVMDPLPFSFGIEKLYREGKKLYSLTNYGTPAIDRAWERFPFFRFFSGRVVSSEEKVAKPDPTIYRILMQRYGIAPEDAIFIDDVKENTDAAAALGFHVLCGCFL